VVAKLLGLVRPDAAVFGEKDYQQLVLVRRMVSDLCLGVDVTGVATVRDTGGLALSSRNRYLSDEERRSALALSHALHSGAAAGPDGPGAVLACAEHVLATAPEVAVDYLVLTDPQLGPAPEHGTARLLVAARVGSTRLLDNIAVDLGRAARE
jgi:pantoate--beta-alanine ligase